MFSRTCMAAALGAAALLTPGVFAQGRGGTTAPPGGTSGGGTAPVTSTPTTTGRTPTTTPTSPSTNPQTTTIQQPIYVSGRILLEDGTPPPEPVTIERVCGGSPHAEGYTDSHGYFSIELGARNVGVMQDASESQAGFGGLGGDIGGSGNSGAFGSSQGGTMGPLGRNNELRFMNCELRGRLPGYRSQAYSLVNRRAMDSPDIGIILMHRIASGEGSVVSASTLAAPKDAKKAFEKAIEALKKRKPEDAAKDLQKAVAAYPGFAAAWFELGRLQMAAGDRETARNSFEAAARSDARYVAPLVELAQLDVLAKNWKGAAEFSDRAAKLDSFDYPQVFLFNAVANYNMQNIEAAEKSARQAEKLDTQHQYPKSSHLIGVILARRKDYQGAAEEFRSYLKFAPDASDAAAVKSQLDQVEKLTAQSGAPADKQEK